MRKRPARHHDVEMRKDLTVLHFLRSILKLGRTSDRVHLSSVGILFSVIRSMEEKGRPDPSRTLPPRWIEKLGARLFMPISWGSSIAEAVKPLNLSQRIPHDMEEVLEGVEVPGESVKKVTLRLW